MQTYVSLLKSNYFVSYNNAFVSTVRFTVHQTEIRHANILLQLCVCGFCRRQCADCAHEVTSCLSFAASVQKLKRIFVE